jgi:hypothetical protein
MTILDLIALLQKTAEVCKDFNDRKIEDIILGEPEPDGYSNSIEIRYVDEHDGLNERYQSLIDADIDFHLIRLQ